jgi:hypothetical protein
MQVSYRQARHIVNKGLRSKITSSATDFSFAHAIAAIALSLVDGLSSYLHNCLLPRLLMGEGAVSDKGDYLRLFLSMIDLR